MKKLSFNELQYELVNFKLKEDLLKKYISKDLYIHNINMGLYNPQIITINFLVCNYQLSKGKARNIPVVIFTNRCDFSKSISFKTLLREVRNVLTSQL